MRSQLVLRSPNKGSGWEDNWAFSGRDESVLRNHLDQLGPYVTSAPLEAWDSKQHRRVIETEDRWSAAMLLFTDDIYSRRFSMEPVIQAETAWTAAGARHLAGLLPAELSDLRDGINRRFGSGRDCHDEQRRDTA